MNSSPCKNRKWLLAFVAAYLAVLCLLTLTERSAPEASIRTFGDALWYSLVTMSTVGYGDLYPVTPLGRFLGAVFILLSLGLFAFLMTLLREMVKDIEDIEGDREMECRTMPIVWGVKATKIIVTVLLLVTVVLIAYGGLSLLPFSHDWHTLSSRFIIFGMMIPLLGALALLWAGKTPVEYHRVQMIIKFAMFMGVMYSFVIQQNLLV